jgi:hypothetical protein
MMVFVLDALQRGQKQGGLKMTKEKLFQLIKNEKTDRDIVVTWVHKEGKLSIQRYIDIKVNLTENRIEFFLKDC